MKAVILAGGLGSRLSEETIMRPKPMVEIGGKPILWHIMKLYSHHGINEFIICCGYKGYLIKEYFANYFLYMSDVTFDLTHNRMTVLEQHAEPWTVTLVDTGEHTQTGGRLARIKPYLVEEDAFCLTYGDGVGDVDITQLVRFHHDHGLLATLTAVAPPGRFGAIEMGADSRVASFMEKPSGDNGLINGGFFVLSLSALDSITQGDHSIFEQEPLSQLAESKQLAAWRHNGFWHPMDTLRDKNYLETLWSSGKAPWKIWD